MVNTSVSEVDIERKVKHLKIIQGIPNHKLVWDALFSRSFMKKREQNND